jgi:Asp/Glu/hydantoin racemase
MNYKYSIRKYLILLLSLSIQSAYANQFTVIVLIRDIIPILEKADKNTLVVFDVDNVISTPADLIGRPKARKIRQEIFKEYENKYGIEKNSCSLYVKSKRRIS